MVLKTVHRETRHTQIPQLLRLSIRAHAVHNRDSAGWQAAHLSHHHVNVLCRRHVVHDVKKLQVRRVLPARKRGGRALVQAQTCHCIADILIASLLGGGFFIRGALRVRKTCNLVQKLLRDELIGIRNLIDNDAVKGDAVSELDGLAADDNGDVGTAGLLFCRHRHQCGANSRVQSPIASHGMGSEEDLGCIFDGMADAVDKRILNLQACVGQGTSKVFAFEQGPGVNNRYPEFLALFVCSDKRLFHDRAPGKGDNNIAVLDLLCGAVGNNLIGNGDLFANKVVDKFAQLSLGRRFRNRRVYG
jgi:hypothetical protein